MIYVLWVVLFILFLGLIFRPETKTTVVEVAPAVDNTQRAVAPNKRKVLVHTHTPTFRKHMARIHKYGTTRGHKRTYRFDRQDERAFKRAQHDYLYMNIDGDACDIHENEELEQLFEIWG